MKRKKMFFSSGRMASRDLPLSRHSQTDKCKISIMIANYVRNVHYIAKSLHTAFPRKLDRSKISSYTIYDIIFYIHLRVLCGPVSSSVFVEDCKDCVFVVACQQLRVHSTTNSQFYLHVTSRAIIEDCQKVSFAPYSWNYPDLEQHFEVRFYTIMSIIVQNISLVPRPLSAFNVAR